MKSATVVDASFSLSHNVLATNLVNRDKAQLHPRRSRGDVKPRPNAGALNALFPITVGKGRKGIAVSEAATILPSRNEP
jgi:hypothetical protein